MTSGMTTGMTEGEFLRFSERFRHKMAAQILRSFHEKRDSRILDEYRKIETWCALPALEGLDFPALSDRYHLHLLRAGLSWKEHNLLPPPFHRQDSPSSVTVLPVTIWLDNLRSAFNVGSILRTAEAFRLGTVCFGRQTPFIDNAKVQKTSMGTFDKVPCERHEDPATLQRPRIALETAPEAPSLFDYAFPPSFTLMLGNEEYGLSREALSHADVLLQIPLLGYKNSLNVACCFCLAAGVISHQLRKA